ncbi:MAG: formate dehydrogenase accessory sulfurtransferase FdhD [Nitrospirota bacterium]
MDPCVKRKIVRIAGSSSEETEDTVATEKLIIISVNNEKVLSLYCTPLMIKEFVVGFCLNEGIIHGHFCADAITIRYGEGMDIYVNVPADGEISTEGMVRTTGCIGGLTFGSKEYKKASDNLFVAPDTIQALFHDFNTKSMLFRATGCMHSAAVSDGETIMVIAEDIGRHNAVDKVIGHCIIENVPLEDKMMLVSGRLSSEIVSKCARWGVPFLISRTSPTNYAIEIAEKANITLIGFVRGTRLNIYTHGHRVIRKA